MTKMKSSKKPIKQRKYRYSAPLHMTGRLMNVQLSKDLKKKFSKRSVRVRTGDRVKVMKGSYKGKSAKVENVDLKVKKIYLAGVESQKKDGTKVKIPISPSNLMITELHLDDKKRQEAMKRK